MVNAPKPTVNNGQAAEKPELKKNIFHYPLMFAFLELESIPWFKTF
jgi:hypothetical protein